MLLSVETRSVARRVCKHGQRAKPPDQLTRTKRVCILQCDACSCRFEQVGKQRYVTAVHHFCSRRCRFYAQKAGGVLYNPHPALVREDVIARVRKASHSEAASQRRSNSLREYHKNKPSDWQNPGNTAVACAKRHQTMKRNGTYKKSSIEERLYEYLCATYGVDDVGRNVLINDRWPIDFHVKSIDTYVQLDGVYWHGLDRPINEIAQHKTKRDVQIHKKWITDRRQDSWFKERGIRLVRLTDRQFAEGVRL